MYLVDTNVISEARKQRPNRGAKSFFNDAVENDQKLFISVVTLGELRRGVERVRHRGDEKQADQLEGWLDRIVSDYSGNILDFCGTAAQLWGRLRVPHPENALDKQIAATALTYDLTVVTRNLNDFLGTGAKCCNPFT